MKFTHFAQMIEEGGDYSAINDDDDEGDYMIISVSRFGSSCSP